MEYNPEKIAQEVEALEEDFGELDTLSNTEIVQFIVDASNNVGETSGSIQMALRLLTKRGIYIDEQGND